MYEIRPDAHNCLNRRARRAVKHFKIPEMIRTRVISDPYADKMRAEIEAYWEQGAGETESS